MTRTSRPRNSSKHPYLRLKAGLAVGLLVAGMNGEAMTKETTMKTNEMTLWQTITSLAEQIPLTRQKVETVLQTTLRESDNTGNDVFQFYESPPVELKDGVVIRTVDLRIKRAGAHPGFMVLEMEGSCVTLDQIRQHYGDVPITSSPRGSSLHEKTHYTATLPWGTLAFGFLERNPGCLASIALKPM